MALRRDGYLSDYYTRMFSGTRYEIGMALGEFYRQNGWAWYRPVDENELGSEQVEYAEKQAELLAARNPGFLEEVAGLAEGMGVDQGKVLSITVANGLPLRPRPSEYSAETGETAGGRAGPAQPGCSSFAWRAPGADGGVYVGRNLDFPLADRTYLARFTRPEDGYATFGCTESLLGYLDGVNEHGLAVTMGIIPLGEYTQDSFLPVDPPGQGWLFSNAIRTVLETCRTTREAVALLTGVPHLEGFSFLVADTLGDFAVVEASPQGCDVRWGEGGAMACTNFFVSSEMMSLQQKHSEHWLNAVLYGLSVQKFMVEARDLILESGGELGVEACEQLLRTLSRDATTGGQMGDTSHTCYSEVFELTSGRIHLCEGTPTRGDYRLLSQGSAQQQRRGHCLKREVGDEQLG